ncbi:MAG: hypothetical protein J6J35_01345 [Alphaproteobacteria bacterium]|nr:hypothetical protein [Alphaproteobacteria bacterium]
MKKKDFLICISAAMAVAGVSAAAWFSKERLSGKIDKLVGKLVELSDDEEELDDE